MKKIIFLLAVLIIAISVFLNVNVNSKLYGISDLSLENIEALAQIEFPEYPGGGGDQWCSINCCVSPGRCWHKTSIFWGSDCQPSGITSDYCMCC